MTNYRHAKHHALDDRTQPDLRVLDSLMDSLEVLSRNALKSEQALALLDHMRRDYARLNTRSASAVETFVRNYQGRYEGLVRA